MGTRQLALTRRIRRSLSLLGIPVLNYHRLIASCPTRNGNSGRFEVSQSSFAEHLRQIGASGCRILAAEELARSPQLSLRAIPSVAVTFDDGRTSDYALAYPMLQYGAVNATFFVNTATVETPGHLTWSQIGEMSRGGMSIQSHSHDHVDLARLKVHQLDYQLRRSKVEIEDHLGREVSVLALPYSSMHQNIIDTALSLGYKAICRSGGGLAQAGSLIINRVCVYSYTSPRQVAAVLRRSPLFFGRTICRAALLSIPKRIIFGFFPGAVDRWRQRHA